MLDFDTALGLLNKYGYTSIQVHPFIYQDGDTIGICYTYVDEEYGLLERIRIFNNVEEFEEFLTMYNWVQVNGKLHHVRMILDNYESINPKVMFLRNEKIMVEGEMFDIEAYDSRESMRANMDPVSKIIYECGDLLLVYNEIKNRQLQYFNNIIKLKNSLRHKYYDLQVEVDKYNKIKVEKTLTLLPEITDSGINEMLEISIKDRYNAYIAQRPSYEEALVFLKEVWELCLGLELNSKYYEAQKEENDIRNEMKIVDQKLTLMRSLNDELKPLFGIDLVSRFRKINKVCNDESTTISNEFISQQIDAVNRKYSYFTKIDSLYTSDYLREAIQNSNYADLAIKYAPGANFEVVSKFKTPLNEVAASLSVQYRDKLSTDEQSIMVLYNNPKFRMICDAILNVESFETAPIKTILKAVSGIKSFSKIKSECYESVKKRIDDPVNQKIKSSLFANFDFSSYETFITSLVNKLIKLKSVNEKMVLNGDINMYVSVKKVEDLQKKFFIMTTNDLQDLIAQNKDSKNMVGITLLKEGTPVLYSPYYFDLGDIYSKGASPEMAIKEMVNFELLIDISDIVINIDPNKTIVAKYFSTPNIVENLSVVDDIRMSYKTTFCKYALTSKLSTVVMMNQSQAVSSNVSPVVNSVFDAGTLASVSTDVSESVEVVPNDGENTGVTAVSATSAVDTSNLSISSDSNISTNVNVSVDIPVAASTENSDNSVVTDEKVEGSELKTDSKEEKKDSVNTITESNTVLDTKEDIVTVSSGDVTANQVRNDVQESSEVKIEIPAVKTEAKQVVTQAKPVVDSAVKKDTPVESVQTQKVNPEVSVKTVSKPISDVSVKAVVATDKPLEQQVTTTQVKPVVTQTVVKPAAQQSIATQSKTEVVSPNVKPTGTTTMVKPATDVQPVKIVTQPVKTSEVKPVTTQVAVKPAVQQPKTVVTTKDTNSVAKSPVSTTTPVVTKSVVSSQTTPKPVVDENKDVSKKVITETVKVNNTVKSINVENK